MTQEGQKMGKNSTQNAAQDSLQGAPKIGFVSLGCPKALVDSERILSKLVSQGYETSDKYEGSEIVVVNTCGFLDSARDESLEAIGEAIGGTRKVVVTGCMGHEADLIRQKFPEVAAITGAHDYDGVLSAIHKLSPPKPDPLHLIGEDAAGIKLTPSHYAYVKISEGCDHTCSFCIIPQFRGKLKSRPLNEILTEVEALARRGVKEILIISQDTSAYGLDIKYEQAVWRDQPYPSHLEGLCRALGVLTQEYGIWVRLHYVYPYPHVDHVIPLMKEGMILPYLDIPFQHAAPSILKAMRRPAHSERTLERIAKWREAIPSLTLRSTFIVGFPGETEADFELLLDWLEVANLDRVGAFAYENVTGASANGLEGHIAEEVKQERLHRFMAVARTISETRLRARLGTSEDIIIDKVIGPLEAIGRTKGDAPEIDGKVMLKGFSGLKTGDSVKGSIVRSDAHDLWAEPINYRKLNQIPKIKKPMHRIITRI